MSCVQPTEVERVERADNVPNCHTIQGFTHGVLHDLLRPRRDLAKLALELRPQLLDQVVVGTVRRLAQDLRSRVLDRRLETKITGASQQRVPRVGLARLPGRFSE